MRIDKYLVTNGYGNKEKAHEYIKDNKVKVNNLIVNDFHYQIKDDDQVSVSPDIKKYKELYYLMLNKPSEYVSARKDKVNKSILSLIPDSYDKETMNIVGRLDKDVTGLILLTNNNKLYKTIINPINNIKKEYVVSFVGNHHLINCNFSNGIRYADGSKTKPFLLDFISDEKAIITLYEGKYHEIKKIFRELNLYVTSIHRITIASLHLDSLEEGKFRELNKEEISSLLALISK